MVWVDPITWIPNVTPGNATNLNGIRDSLKAVGDAWTPYTPALTSTSSPTMGASTIAGRYRNTGKTWDVHINLAIGAGFSGGTGVWRLSLPAGLTPITSSTLDILGYASARDVSATTQLGYFAYYANATSVSLFKGADGTFISAAAPWTWATGDLISIHLPNVESI